MTSHRYQVEVPINPNAIIRQLRVTNRKLWKLHRTPEELFTETERQEATALLVQCHALASTLAAVVEHMLDDLGLHYRHCKLSMIGTGPNGKGLTYRF